MDSKPNSRAVRVGGEVIVLHCWACGTAHCVNLELCVPGELSHMVCSNSNCGMSMFPVESACSNRIALTDMAEKIGHRDPLYLFVCHLEWLTKRNLAAYQELLAALDDHDGDIRRLAEYLLHRSSPRPGRTATGIGSW
jgi:hypothetical protein